MRLQFRRPPVGFASVSKCYPHSQRTRRGANGNCESQSLLPDQKFQCIAAVGHNHRQQVSDNSK
eukprot:5408840-Pyramimonas_sp.AAC.1